MDIKSTTLFSIFSFLLVFLSFTPLAFAGTVTQDTDIPEPSKTVDFSQFTGDFSADCPGSFFLEFCFTTGPIQVGDLVFEDITWSSTGDNSVIGNGVYGLGVNGLWNDGRSGYVGTDSELDTVVMRFDFNDGPVCAVGGFVNYAPGFGDPFTMKALDSGNVVLEVFDVTNNSPISTPGVNNDGVFRGIVRATNEIVALELSGEFDVLDDLKFARCDTTVVGGELLPIDTTALFLTGIQSSSVWMILILAGLPGSGVYLVKFRTNKE